MFWSVARRSRSYRVPRVVRVLCVFGFMLPYKPILVWTRLNHAVLSRPVYTRHWITKTYSTLIIFTMYWEGLTQQTQNICITFVQCWANVEGYYIILCLWSLVTYASINAVCRDPLQIIPAAMFVFNQYNSYTLINWYSVCYANPQERKLIDTSNYIYPVSLLPSIWNITILPNRTQFISYTM